MESPFGMFVELGSVAIFAGSVFALMVAVELLGLQFQRYLDRRLERTVTPSAQFSAALPLRRLRSPSVVAVAPSRETLHGIEDHQRRFLGRAGREVAL